MAKQIATTRSGRLGERANGSSLAVTVADRMVGDIAAAGWPVGEIVGYEGELLERYGVSRDVFREAVRLLEHLQVARMRHGPGGARGATADRRLGHRRRVGLPRLRRRRDRRRLRGPPGARAARCGAGRRPARRDPHRRASGAVAGEAARHRGRPPAASRPRRLGNRQPRARRSSSTCSTGSRCSTYAHPLMADETLQASARAHAAIVEAILAGDAGLARRTDAQAPARRGRVPPGPPPVPSPPRRPPRRRRTQRQAGRADRLGDLPRDRRGWLAGRRAARLGSRAPRPLRRQPGRAARGRAGARAPPGRPDAPGPRRRAVRRRTRGRGGHRSRRPPSRPPRHVPADLFEVRGAVEMVGARPRQWLDATTKARRGCSPPWKPSGRRPSPSSRVVGHDLHGVLASIAGNPVLELLVLVLLRLTRFHVARPRAPAGAGDRRPMQPTPRSSSDRGRHSPPPHAPAPRSARDVR